MSERSARARPKLGARLVAAFLLASGIWLRPELGWAGSPIPPRTRVSVTSFVLGVLPPFGDFDFDGVINAEDAFPRDASESSDLDGDGIGDNADLDDDGDGVPDLVDLYPADPSESSDFDGDGIGDNADSDDDNDGFLDAFDAFPFDPSEGRDTDADGIGDNADLDDDGDGVEDVDDGAPTQALEDSLFSRRQGIRRAPQAQCDLP